jgi:hypothetical protein
MNRKNRIASAMALVGVLAAVAPVSVYAGSPLLSGYGGPGAGEQAIVGSTLLGGPRGGAGSGGSSGLGAGGGNGSSGGGNGSSSGSNVAGTGGTSPSDSGSGSSKAASRRASQAGGSAGIQPAQARAYVYPSVPASAQGDSSVIGISLGDVFPMIAVAAMIAVVGVLTVRLSRLQP